MIAIFTERIEDGMKVFMDDFLMFGESFDQCLENLGRVLKRYEDTNCDTPDQVLSPPCICFDLVCIFSNTLHCPCVHIIF